MRDRIDLFDRGMICETKKMFSNGIECGLQKGVVARVLILDITSAKEDYPAIRATDSLNNMGWCKFDDISECLSLEEAKKVIAFCEKKTRTQANPPTEPDERG